MAVAELTDTLRDISLHDNALLFSPNAHARWSNLTLEHVPRFLFRVYTPRSDGFTDETVASSRDASLGVEGSNEDVFATQTPAVTAKLIADHLLWTPGHRKDNLVSWSSSMLFLIRYIFYKHYNINDRSHIRDIQLLVVDTEKFQARTFIRDLDLISAFRRFNIQAFHSLSNWRTTDKYFGEYLSQGSLDIEGKCSIVSAQTMISSGLLDLHIDFKHANEGRDSDKWAKSVLQIRDTITAARHKQPVSLDVLDKAYQVAMEFGAPWSLPIAISLMALIPHALERREAYDRLWIRLRPTGKQIFEEIPGPIKIIDTPYRP